MDNITSRLKNISFKKINKKEGFKNIAILKVVKPHIVKVKHIILPENLIALDLDKNIFSLNAQKLSLIIILKVVL